MKILLFNERLLSRSFLLRVSMLLFLVMIGISGFARQRNRYVLYINSYTMSFPATIDQFKGIQSALDSPYIIIDVEFMDSKRFPLSNNKESFKERLMFKLKKSPHYDAIIASDDDAFRFVIENQNTLFSNTPIFFLGVNDIKFGLLQNNNKWVAGLLERPSFDATIGLMLKLFPKHHKIYIVCDHSLTGISDYEDIKALMPKYKGLKYETIWSDHYTREDFLKKLSTLDKEVPLLFESAYINRSDSSVRTFNESIKMVSSHFGGPVFSLWMYGVRSGALGGNVISFFQHGRIVGNMVRQVLYGADISKMKVISNPPYQCLFNYDVMKKFNISTWQLPDDTKYLNKPLSIYEQNKMVVISTLVFIILLILLISFLIRSNLLRKKASKELVISKIKAEESDRLKTDFIRNMSHEIKTPLNSIVGFAGLISSDTNSRQDNETYIALVKDNVGQLMTIIRKLFEISSLESKSESLSLEQISIIDVLNDQYRAYQETAEKKGLELVFDNLGSDKDYVFLSDASKIAKIVSYLLENAIKFTIEGCIHLGFKMENNLVVIYVKDTGIGISEEQQKIIFSRFIQGENQLSRRYGGIGLGLSIARENAILLGGEIRLQSVLGKGTTFFVRLPQK